MTNLKTTFTFLFGTSTFFDDDEGWVTIPLNGYFKIRTFEVFGGWKCRQALKDGEWYDID